MGIFDIFKTKITEAADKAGDVAENLKDKAGDAFGDLKDKVSDMVDKKDDAPAAADTAQTAEDAGVEGAHNAEEMVSEGSPVMEAQEPGEGSGGMTGSIKDNLDSGAQRAKDMMGNG